MLSLFYTSQITIGHTVSFQSVTVFTSHCLVMASMATFPFLWVLKLSLASATSFSQQQFTTTEPQLLSNSLQQLTGSAYNISAQTAQKTQFLLLFMGCCLVTAVV
jgi:hypothetical protein